MGLYLSDERYSTFGGESQTSWAEEVRVMRDDGGYLVTGPDSMHDSKPPAGWPLGRSRAAGQGAMAVTFIHRYLSEG